MPKASDKKLKFVHRRGKGERVADFSYFFIFTGFVYLRYLIFSRIRTTVCLKKSVPSSTGCRFDTHPPIFTIFGARHQQRFKNRLHV